MNGGLPEAQAARTIDLLRARLVERAKAHDPDADRELVRALVQFDARMPLDALETHLVRLGCSESRLPEVLVLDRLLGRRLPTVLLPVLQPALGEGLLDVRRIGHHQHVRRAG